MIIIIGDAPPGRRRGRPAGVPAGRTLEAHGLGQAGCSYYSYYSYYSLMAIIINITAISIIKRIAIIIVVAISIIIVNVICVILITSSTRWGWRARSGAFGPTSPSATRQ